MKAQKQIPTSFGYTFPQNFFNWSIGLSDLFDDFEKSFTASQHNNNYPPYNIEKVGDNKYELSLAVAGFNKSNIEITHQKQYNKLLVEGTKEKDESSSKKLFTHRGIAERDFKQSFVVADDVQVQDAKLEDGLLTISLEKIIPDEKQPQKIAIQ